MALGSVPVRVCVRAVCFFFITTHPPLQDGHCDEILAVTGRVSCSNASHYSGCLVRLPPYSFLLKILGPRPAVSGCQFAHLLIAHHSHFCLNSSTASARECLYVLFQQIAPNHLPPGTCAARNYLDYKNP